MEALDQIFVTLRDRITGLFPPAWQPLAGALLAIVAIMAVYPGIFAITTVVERKLLGRFQNRPGPNRTGIPLTKIRLAGFGQFAADGIKSLTKEDIVPRDADRVVHYLAPFVLVVPAFLALAVLPVGRNLAAVDLPETGLLFFFAVGGAAEVSVFMAGWSSRNKYSLLGALRGIAQMLSYEVPLILSSLPVVMLSGTLSLAAIAARQSAVQWGVVHAWHVFTPWGLAGFLLFLAAACAESNRTPFDLPEAESELVAGYFTEYSGFKFALFFLGEYLGMFAVCGVAITLFLGGWNPPFTFLDWTPSWAWFFAKLAALIVVLVWLRATLPRLRTDQLMGFAWRYLLPMSLANLVAAGAWHLLAPRGDWIRWPACALFLAAVHWALVRGFSARFKPRAYRYGAGPAAAANPTRGTA